MFLPLKLAVTPGGQNAPMGSFFSASVFFLVVLVLTWLSPVHAKSRGLVIIGDSHTCGPFGRHLLGILSGEGVDATAYCAVSSSPIHWMRGRNPKGQICQVLSTDDMQSQKCGVLGKMPSLSEIQSKHPNTDVLVALGTNSLHSSKPDAAYLSMTQKLMSNTQACFWVGPPHLDSLRARGYPSGSIGKMERNLSDFYMGLLNITTGRCTLIDSRPFTEVGTAGFNTVDGVHRTQAAGKSWAEQVAKSLRL